jgi:hypothetical protein
MIPAKRFADKIYKELNAMEIPEGTRSINLETYIDREHVRFVLTFGRNKLNYSCEPNCPKWSMLNCNEITENVKSNCRTTTNFNHTDTIIRKYKIYVNGYRDLLSYIQGIKSGIATKAFNRKVWGVVLCNWNWVNHNIGRSVLTTTNTDIDILHFKFKKT